MKNILSHKGFQFISKDESYNNKLTAKVDECLSHALGLSTIRPKKYEEIFSYMLLQEIFHEHEIILADNGSKDSTPDIMAKNNEEEIGIEVTQFIENNYSLTKQKNKPPSKHSKRRWIVALENRIAKEVDKRTFEKIDLVLSNIEKIYYDHDIMISFLYPQNKNIANEIAYLKSIGVTHIASNKNSLGENRIQFDISGFVGFTLGEIPTDEKHSIINEILSLAHQEAVKIDNQKKLLSENNGGKSMIFIPIGFSFVKTSYMSHLLTCWGGFSADKYIKVDENYVLTDYHNIFNHIDTVFIAIFFSNDRQKRFEFSVLKIIKRDCLFIFEKLFHNHPYDALKIIKHQINESTVKD